MRHAHHVVVEGGGGQPDAGGQLVVEQRQLRDQTLGLLLLGGQCGQALADAHQGLDELSLGRQALRLQGREDEKGRCEMYDVDPVRDAPQNVIGPTIYLV